MFLHLSADFAGFPNWHAPGQEICAFVIYAAPTTVPTGNSTLTCPNATPAGANGCGPAIRLEPELEQHVRARREQHSARLVCAGRDLHECGAGNLYSARCRMVTS